jgi:hypothetical protein
MAWLKRPDSLRPVAEVLIHRQDSIFKLTARQGRLTCKLRYERRMANRDLDG